ncbi:hypothetical protein BO94DRAFT_557014 [Aspergillus sclerotioniger CBS 115572]|uniref:Uncharacterized protein n=1 Tax=Aspergillus sclerotioniger CBS 115572 TaxID=1450535 RepID=A0A317WJC7_9EURO|nr:hypothetical protein BO94DRAFT_557014 [Aspergillus sclerotioniger CBS 115572]PWY86556.1 hypothetical protein BO94DRAFT_557014 [Aspergillus sclerotioniger CBS 115572]
MLSCRLSSRSSPPREDFFKNTSRRWIMNENDRGKERYVKFDPNELQRVAGRAIGEDHCPFIIKLAEGGFNKVFLLRASSGKEVIARIPTPIAGPSHYTTASEVATMDFLRGIIGIPIPKVLAYSTSATNPVGAEYILMERIEGVSLASRWLSLTTEEVKSVMKQIVEMEQRTFTYSFPGYGSLYHQKDIKGEEQIPIPVEDFCIGPVAARQFWHGDRNKTKIDRGPWLSPKYCFTSAARRETTCILNHAKPQPRKTFLLPTLYDIEPSEHISLLSKFLRLAPFLISTNPDHNSPILRHPDLSLDNILLEPGSTIITSIIDWQDTVIFPLFMQAGYPAFCEHDLSQPQSLQPPTLPDNFNYMNQANSYYTATTGIYNDIHMNALRIPHLGMRRYLYQQTGYPWDADIINLRAALIGITTPHIWDAISSVPCPVSFTDQKRETAKEDSEEWIESEKLLSAFRDHLGVDLEGGTVPKNFEWASHRNVELRLEMLQQAEHHERDICWQNWPFKDDADFSYSPL